GSEAGSPSCGNTTVTPVRTLSRSISVEWPTRAPATSVIALFGPGSASPIAIPSSRARTFRRSPGRQRSLVRGTPARPERPIQAAMEAFMVECLRCGDVRQIQARQGGHVQAGGCKRCDYVGWASVADLTEKLRRILRERPPERRRLYAAS